MKFQDVIGQEKITGHLQNAIRMQKVSHAYLIQGEQGSGKKMLASIFAKTLQGEEKGIEPCGKCRSCKQADSYNHPDIRWITHEKATIGVDDIRLQLNNDILIKPYSSDYKIYIIEDAEKMTEQAQNAMLKTIEEPPEYVIFLFATTDPQKILPTILSDGTGGYKAKSEIDLKIARPLCATMAKMHRACQDNYVTQKGRVRRLTPRECARLQGFEDSFVIPVSDCQAYKQFGNAVTVNVSRAVAQSVKDTLKELGEWVD